MTPTDRDPFYALLRGLAATFSKTLKPEVYPAYFEALQLVPFSELQRAAESLARTQRHWPRPVDFLDAAQRTRTPVSQPAIPPPVVLPDGTTEAAYYCGICEDTGWRPDCGCPVDNLELNRQCRVHGGRLVAGYDQPRPRSFEPCSCRSHNPVWAHGHQVRYAEERGVKPGA